MAIKEAGFWWKDEESGLIFSKVKGQFSKQEVEEILSQVQEALRKLYKF